MKSKYDKNLFDQAIAAIESDSIHSRVVQNMNLIQDHKLRKLPIIVEVVDAVVGVSDSVAAVAVVAFEGDEDVVNKDAATDATPVKPVGPCM
jgi:hypothetical protein